MADRIHDHEADTGEAVARALLQVHRPDWATARLTAIGGSGTDNALWRIDPPDGSALVLRLPRMEAAARSLEAERTVLERLASRPLPVPVPTIRLAGPGGDVFPHPWLVAEWLPGVDGWSAREAVAASDETVAAGLAEFVRVLAEQHGLTDRTRQPGGRGGPVGPVLDRLDRWLDDPAWSAADLVDLPAVRRAVAETREVADEAVEVGVVHGDLLPGNLLFGEDGPSAGAPLVAVIDWGSAGLADPAQDLTPAWAVLGERGRQVFREALDVDDATWLRGRAFELEHAVGAILYYTPRRHPLAEVMARTLDRLLSEPRPGG